MKAFVLTVGSFALTATVLANAYMQKKQFYPSVVYITKSNPSMAVLYLQAFVVVILMGKLIRKIFFGQLRAAEMEHLIERSWYAVTETCLAFTVFRDDFSPRFVALFTLLLFLKSFHWLAEDRVDYMERSPIISWLFHLRVVSLLAFLGLLDVLFINHAYYSTLTKGASVQLVFGFEYAILLTVVLTIFVKYILHTIDLNSENPWENSAVYMLYTDLFLGGIKVLLYILFLGIMIKVHTFPLFAIRPMYLTMRAFKKALNDVIMSRRAIRNMNTLYPDATDEELREGDNVCIICREEMTQGCKKLPCNHIFHTGCLRSWFQRQQTCPTCRMDVLRPPVRRTTPPHDNNNQQAPPQPPQQPQMPPGFPGFQAPFMGAWPQAQQQQVPSSQTGAADGSSASTAAPGAAASASAAVPPFMMMPPFMMPMPFGMACPQPGADFSGLTNEELIAMEGWERQQVETRVQCLRNIQTLLDAAVLQLQQYTTLMQQLGPHNTTDVAGGNNSDGQSKPKSETKLTTTQEQQQSNSEEKEISPELTTSSHNNKTLEPDLSNLEGAVGFSEPTTKSDSTTSTNSLVGNGDCEEIRRRRIEHFSQSKKDHPPDSDEN